MKTDGIANNSRTKRKATHVAWATIVLLLATVSLVLGQGPGQGQGTSVRPFPRRPEPVPDRYIVQFRAGSDPVAQTERLARQHGLTVGFIYRDAIQGFSAVIPPGRLKQVQDDPAVLLVEPDLIVRTAAQTTPTGIQRIGATANPIAAIDGNDSRVNIDVAVIDTGIDYTHPDLNVFARTDCVDYDFFAIIFGTPTACYDNEGTDENSHGTHVAGTIGALDNGIGVVGVAPGARLWAVRVLDYDGSGYLSWVVAGVDYVAKHSTEIEVANMSLGFAGNASTLRTAIQNAVNKGVVFVVAAGNDDADVFGPDGVFGTSDDFEPAAYPEVATISALADSDGLKGGLGAATAHGPDDTLATFSNFSAHNAPGNPVNSPGGKIDFAAPGVDIYSTLPVANGSYGTGSGTSMATPHATGAIALYIAANGRATNAAGVAAIRQAMINAAEAQSVWGPVNTNDTDGNREGMVFVGTGTTPSNLPPVVTIALPTNNAKYNSGSSVSFSGSVADDHDTSLSITWSSSKQGVLGTGATLNKILVDGIHTITASSTDLGGKTGSSNVLITVGCAPTQSTVTGITYSLSKSKKDLNSIVTVKDNCGKPVVGASVSIYLWNLTRGVLWTATGTTNQSGQETFLLRNAPTGQYETDITDVKATGLTWDGVSPPNSYTKK